MLFSSKSITACKLASTDGELGAILDVLFDELDWTVKYLAARTGEWLTSRTVMIAPRGNLEITPGADFLTLQMTWKQIFDSPVYSGYRSSSGARPLCSAVQMRGYGLQAADGACGSVDDVIFDSSTWRVRHLVINPPNGCPGGKVLISPRCISLMNHDAFNLVSGLSRADVCSAPAYSGQTPHEHDPPADRHCDGDGSRASQSGDHRKQHLDAVGRWDNEGGVVPTVCVGTGC